MCAKYTQIKKKIFFKEANQIFPYPMEPGWQKLEAQACESGTIIHYTLMVKTNKQTKLEIVLSIIQVQPWMISIPHTGLR